MKKSLLIVITALSLNPCNKLFATSNIDSVVTWAYYQGWYEAARSYYYYTGNSIDSIISWSYNSGWYESGKTYYYYNGGAQIDSTNSLTYYQGWYDSGRGYYYYTGGLIDSVLDYTYNQGWYFSNRSYYTYAGNCIDSITGFTYYQGWYESTHSHYYSQPNCQIDSVYTSSYYQGWYDAAHSYYYYGTGTGIESQKMDNNKLIISPNPARDKILVHFENKFSKSPTGNNHFVSIELYNLFGEKINADYNTFDNNGKLYLEIHALKPAVYFIKAETFEGTYYQRFIKE